AVLAPRLLAACHRGRAEAVRPHLPGPDGVRAHQPRAEVRGEKQANRRIRLLLGCFVLVFAIALGRAAWLQVVHAATLGRQAQRMHQEPTTPPAGRGAILDRTGVPLAIGEQTTTIYADPHMVLDPRGVAIAAHRLLGVDANVLYPRL